MDTALPGRGGSTVPGAVESRRRRLQAWLTALRARRAWVDHLFRAGARYVEQRGNHFAAAVTFFSVLTAVPLLMIAFAAAGYVLWFNPTLLAQLERSVATAAPGELADALAPIVETAIDQRNTVAGIGLAAALWSGIWWMSNLREAVSAQWGLPARGPAALRRLMLRDLVALVGLGTALLVSMAVTVLGTGLAATVLDLIGTADDGWNRALLRGAAIAVGLAANWLILLWAITRLPRTDVAVRGAAGAALLGAVALEALKQGAAVYLDVVTTSAAGAVFGSLLGLLLFGYLVARLVLLATAWAATADLAPAGRGRPPGPAGTVDARVVPRPGGAAMPVTSPSTGPVEWVALTFPGSVLDPGVARPLADLVGSGTVSILDAVVVHKAADCTVTEGELDDEGAGTFDGIDGEVLELLSHDDLLAIAELLEPDTSTLVVAWENRWATAFAEAVRRHGGRVLAHDRVPRADAERAMQAAGLLPAPEGVQA